MKYLKMIFKKEVPISTVIFITGIFLLILSLGDVYNRRRFNRRLDQMKDQMKDRFNRMDDRFDRMDDRFDEMRMRDQGS